MISAAKKSSHSNLELATMHTIVACQLKVYKDEIVGASGFETIVIGLCIVHLQYDIVCIEIPMRNPGLVHLLHNTPYAQELCQISYLSTLTWTILAYPVNMQLGQGCIPVMCRVVVHNATIFPIQMIVVPKGAQCRSFHVLKEDEVRSFAMVKLELLVDSQ